MPEVIMHRPGSFCWADLATPDPEAAKAFYTKLFSWEAQDVPAGETDVYTMLNKGGKAAAALFQMPSEMQQQGMPAYWQCYVSVEDVDRSAEKAAELGGTVVAPPFDVMKAGRMAVVQDPTGAVLCLWQPKQHIGAQVRDEPGALCWNELCTKDVSAARAFYEGLFGWNVNEMTGAIGQAYDEFRAGEQSVGGMMEIQKEWGEVPPHWSVYFAVDDCDAIMEMAKRLGGKNEMQPMDIENVGRFVMLQDPQGGHFLVLQMKWCAD